MSLAIIQSQFFSDSFFLAYSFKLFVSAAKPTTILGLSDHTHGGVTVLGAVALGAKVIEKHFTLDRKLDGPDHKASIEPEELKSLVESIRNIENALGTNNKNVTSIELGNMKVARKSLVATKSIKCGDTFSESNLTTKRPGNGMSPMLWDKILGKKWLKKLLVI